MIDRSINQPTNQSIHPIQSNPSINQSINQSIDNKINNIKSWCIRSFLFGFCFVFCHFVLQLMARSHNMDEKCMKKIWQNSICKL